jgi:hypothetical protein
MKARAFLHFQLLFILYCPTIIIAQPVLRNLAELKLSLAFTKESGTYGTAVAFNPKENAYFAVIEGNKDYPLEKFDQNGSSISASVAGIDVRGMWWNPKTGALESNAFSGLGYYKLELSPNGDPIGTAIQILPGKNQPYEQSVGTFDPVKQEIFFYSIGAIYSYSRKNGKAGKRVLFLDLPVEIEKINNTSLIYTGIKGIEFGLLNFVDSEVLFFDKKTGRNTGIVSFIHNAPVNDTYCFSFANKLVWLYNSEYRIFYGYEIFK